MIDAILGFLVEFWEVLSEMAPYLLFGFLVAGFLSVLISQRLVERHLGGEGLGSVIKASLFGIPLPLCSCGVIPVAASIRRQGAGRGATTSFLLSTPKTGIDSILVTFSLLGLLFAIYIPIAALVTGIAGGWLVSVFTRGQTAPQAASPEACKDDTCCSGLEETGGKKGSRVRRALRYGFVTMPEDIGTSLIVGLAIAGVIAVALPEDFFARTLSNEAAQMLVLMIFGIPIYVCATASVPVAAALMAKGISPGAVLVFLMTGPATNAATITTIWKIMGRRTAFLYLGNVAIGAVVFGVLLNYIYSATAVEAVTHVHWEMPMLLRVTSAALLIGVLANALLRPFARREKAEPEGGPPPPDSETSVLEVEGMTCSHCAQNVRRALGELEGVQSVKVELKTRQAVVCGRKLDVDLLRRSVESLGYTVAKVKRGSET